MAIKIPQVALAVVVMAGMAPWAASQALSQTVSEPAAASTGDWGILATLAGKQFSGRVNGGVGIVRFAKGPGNTMGMSFGMIGMKPSTVAFSLTGKDTADISFVEGPRIAPRGKQRPVSNQVDIKPDGFLIEWNASPSCVVRGGGNGGCFFSRLVSDSGVRISTFLVKDGELIENASSSNGGRVEFKPFP